MDMRTAIYLKEVVGRAKAEQIIIDLERPLNNYLLKVMAAQVGESVREYWIREISNWIMEIEGIRFKPSNRPGPKNLYFRILFDEPFGGVEERSVSRRLLRLSEDNVLRDDVQVPDLVRRLRAFHERLAERCAAGMDIKHANYWHGIRDLLAGL